MKHRLISITLILSMIIGILGMFGCSVPHIEVTWPDQSSSEPQSGITDDENTNPEDLGGTDRKEYDSTYKDSKDTSEAKKVRDLISDLMHSNTYITIKDGPDSSETFVYNTKGECIAQGSKGNYITVFRNDNISYSFTDMLHVGEDISMLQIIYNSLEKALNGEATIKIPKESFQNDLKGLRIYLDGWDKVNGIYAMISDEFALKMITNMQNNVMSNDFGLIFDIIYADDNRLSVDCNLSVDGRVYTSWYFDGYLTLSDWELQKEWYSLGLEENADDDDKVDLVEKAESLLDETIEVIGVVMRKYASDNGIEIDDPNTDEGADAASDTGPGTTDETEEKEETQDEEGSSNSDRDGTGSSGNSGSQNTD